MTFNFTQTEYDKVESELDRLYVANDKLTESLEQSYQQISRHQQEILDLASYTQSLEHTLAQEKALTSTLLKRLNQLDMELSASRAKPEHVTPQRVTLQQLAEEIYA